MARRRMLSPEIWDSESFGSLSILSKLLWIGLISNADDDGRGRWQPSWLKSRLLPYDDLRDADIKKALSEIGHKMSVLIYESDGKQYYSLTEWKKWQSIQKPTASLFPAPPSDGVGGELPSTVKLQDDYNSSTVVVQDEYSLEEKRKEVEEKRKEVEENAPDGLSRISIFREVIDYLNATCGTAYKPTTSATQKHIQARINEGYTLEDFKKVIDKKVAEWKGTEMEQYLRPETLFGSKFESYLNAKIIPPKKVKGADDKKFSNERNYSIEELDKALEQDFDKILESL